MEYHSGAGAGHAADDLDPWGRRRGQGVHLPPFSRFPKSLLASEFGRAPRPSDLDCDPLGNQSYSYTAFDYLRDDVFESNDWFENSKHLPRPPGDK